MFRDEPTPIGVLSIQGLPARYGAFEQTADQLARHLYNNEIPIRLWVGCHRESREEEYDLPNVVRVYTTRRAALGVILYGLLSFAKLYRRGVRTFLVFGYALSPFFPLFTALGCRIVCNVDGIEWRRAKWGRAARLYLKFCERAAVRSRAELIFDAYGIARYYHLTHGRRGHIIFYGTEQWTNEQSDLALEGEMALQSYYVVVMRLEPENHILEIVEGFLESRVDAELVIVGPGTEFFETKVMPLIHGSGKVKWIGPIYDRMKLYAIRKGAKAYIHGHSVGGTNPTLVEACDIGRPIFAFASIFNREVLKDNAVYFSDARSLARALDATTPLPTPPRLDYRYTWPHICEGYVRILMGHADLKDLKGERE